MRPINTPAATTRWIGAGDVGELPAETFLEQDGTALVRVNRSRWRPDEAERAALALGGDVVLDVFGSQHPPVRILATVFPVDDADGVFGRVDTLLDTAVGLSIVGLLGSLGIETTLEEIGELDPGQTDAVAAWLRDDRFGPIPVDFLEARRPPYTAEDRAIDDARIDQAIAKVEAEGGPAGPWPDDEQEDTGAEG